MPNVESSKRVRIVRYDNIKLRPYFVYFGFSLIQLIPTPPESKEIYANNV